MDSLPACQILYTNGYTLSPTRSIIDTEELFWHINDYHPDLDQGEQLREITAAYASAASLLSPIKVTPTSDKSKAHTVVFFASDNDPNDRPRDPFGSESTLAQAYFPVNNYSEIWIDRDEDWSTSVNSRGISMRIVTEHEIYHTLGIGHTNVRNDIMYPSYNPNGRATQDTIDAVETLYGEIKQRIRDREAETPTTPSVPDTPETPVVPTPPSIPEGQELAKSVLLTAFPTPYAMYRLHNQRLKDIAEQLGHTIVGRRKIDLVNQLYRIIKS